MHVISTLASVVLGCAACSDAVDVKVQPTKYVVGTKSYELETAAVDELFRLKPNTVRIYLCPDTPVDRAMKFNRVWVQRLHTQPKITVTDAAC